MVFDLGHLDNACHERMSQLAERPVVGHKTRTCGSYYKRFIFTTGTGLDQLYYFRSKKVWLKRSPCWCCRFHSHRHGQGSGAKSREYVRQTVANWNHHVPKLGQV